MKEGYQQIVIDMVKEVGEVLLRNLGKKKMISRKSTAIDLVTDIDKLSQQIIIDRLKKHFKNCNILAEENIQTTNYKLQTTNYKYRWLIDPLDGTVNYAHTLPVFAISIALEKDNNEIIFGVIYNPVANELFLAEKNKGAYLNNKKISVSTTKYLKDSLLATGFPYNIRETKGNLKEFCQFAVKAQAIRRIGSAALDLAYVAAGRLDGYWEYNINPWDIAAGSLLVEEAGGYVSDYKGNKLNIYKKEIVASNKLIHQAMISVLNNET